MTIHSDEIGVAPEQSWEWARKILPRRMQPMVRGLRKRLLRRTLRLDEPYHTVFPYTQVALIRQENIVRLAKLIESNKIPGAVVECGVLDGGVAALMAWATSSSPRPVHLFDAWQGLPNPSTNDGSAAIKWKGQVVGSTRRVKAVMKKLNVAKERVHFHVGWFADTFPKASIDRIALLHIDPDFYDPVKLCLSHWYDHISPGGYIQIDDYEAFSGCRKATDEFLAAHPEAELEFYGDGPKAFFIRKPRP